MGRCESQKELDGRGRVRFPLLPSFPVTKNGEAAKGSSFGLSFSLKEMVVANSERKLFSIRMIEPLRSTQKKNEKKKKASIFGPNGGPRKDRSGLCWRRGKGGGSSREPSIKGTRMV